MIEIRVEIVDSNCINTQSLHENGISQTDVSVTQRVNAGTRIEAGGTTRLVTAAGSVLCSGRTAMCHLLRDTNNLKAAIVDAVDKIGAFDD